MRTWDSNTVDFVSAASVRFRTAVLWVLVLAFAAPSSSQIPAAEPLALNQSREFEIKGGETKAFSVAVSRNQTARVEIEQLGVDVSLAATNPAGEKFIETESPSGLYGSDVILVTASSTGKYTILVTPANPRSPSGKFKIRLSQLRPTTAEDFRINEAARRITKLAEETGVDNSRGTIEGRRAALGKWREVIALSKIKKDVVWEGIALLSSGLIFEQLGEIQNALDVYTRSLEIWQRIGNRQYEASAVNNLGIIHNDLGEYDKAIANYNRAIELQREIGNRRSVGIYLNNLAYAQMRLGNHEKADVSFRESLAIKQEDESSRGQRSVAVTLNNLGMNLLLKGDRAAGMDFVRRGLDLRRKIDDKWGIANSLLNLAKAESDSGQFAGAKSNATEANIRAIELGDRRMEAESHYISAVSEHALGNTEKALLNVDRGLELVEKIRGELIGSEVRYAYFSTVQNYYDLYVELLMSKRDQTGDHSFAARALEISERSRSRTLIDLLRQENVNIQHGIDANLLERFKTSQSQLNEKYNARLRLLSESPSAEQITAVNADIGKLVEEAENLRSEIRAKHPRYLELTEGATISAAEIQLQLDSETVLIEFKLADKRSFLWFVANDRIEAFELPGRQVIEPKSQAFYRLIATDDPSRKAALDKAAGEFGAMLFGPVADRIAGKRIVIVADGPLQSLPFSALFSPRGNAESLAAEHEIVLLPSASVLAGIRDRAATDERGRKTAAVFADPVFDRNDARIRRPAKRRPEQDSSAKASRMSLPRLLASREEAESISVLSGAAEIDLFTGFSASLENARRSDLARYRILHFATHGIVDLSKPGESGLVFSRFDQNGAPRDGFLNLDGIYNLDLSSDLVVLSACQTALGKDVRGEGLIGLSRGFLHAGSSRVVASLWKVDDSATAEFMKRFYRHLLKEKRSASAALRQAKLEMKAIPRYRSPFFWAGFTLLGDWR